jgi:hypothetical protein
MSKLTGAAAGGNGIGRVVDAGIGRVADAVIGRVSGAWTAVPPCEVRTWAGTAAAGCTADLAWAGANDGGGGGGSGGSVAVTDGGTGGTGGFGGMGTGAPFASVGLGAGAFGGSAVDSSAVQASSTETGGETFGAALWAPVAARTAGPRPCIVMAAGMRAGGRDGGCCCSVPLGERWRGSGSAAEGARNIRSSAGSGFSGCCVVVIRISSLMAVDSFFAMWVYLFQPVREDADRGRALQAKTRSVQGIFLGK